MEKFGIVVIGGGPAGMMAAIKASEKGARVLLLEKNATLGRKLLITGKGRCNITQADCDNGEFVDKLGKKGRFLYSALSRFSFLDTVDFFEKKGVKTKIERGGRVFPASDSSKDVLNALVSAMKENGVKIATGKKVLGFNMKDGKIESIECQDEKIFADKFILATGGKSYPVTGSTGDGYQWVREIGHQVVETYPALVPVKVKDVWVKELQGLSLRNVEINVFQDNKRAESRFGEMLFTHFGISGPIVLDVSKKIGELLRSGKVEISIDLKPALEYAKLKERLQRDFDSSPKKTFRNYLPELLPRKMVDVMLKLSEIDSEKQLCVINGNEKKKLLNLLKNLRLEVEGLLGFEHAIITTGGVDLKEVDSKKMQSRIIDNLYFTGEILDLDAPTGGYNLQICWSTGYAAGESCVE
ncbi:NAD(P)/FAD-dependent oxidoreductase [Patescibacteria group bacterium]